MSVNDSGKNDKTLRAKGVALIVVSVSLIPLLLIGYLILHQFDTAYRAKIEDHLTALVKKQSRTIDGFLVDRLGDIRVLARSHSGTNLLSGDFLQPQLTILREEYGGVFVDLGLIDPEGVQQRYAGPFNLAKAKYSGTRWFSEAQKREYFVSDVFTGLRGTPHFIVAVRLDVDGRGWILRATVDFQSFNSLVSNLKIGRTGFAFILNREGEFQTKPEFDVALNRGPYLDILKTDLGEGRVIVREEEDGRGRRAVFAFTALNRGRWVLFLQQSSADAFAPLRKAHYLSLFLILASTIVIALGAVYLSRRMTSRLREVIQEKDKMSTQVVEAGRLASIGELAAGIAHEINNPVAIMVEEAGWIQDLLAEDEPATEENMAEIQRATNQIRTQGERCKEITQKLLSFARKTDPTTKEIAVNELIQDVVSLVDSKARYANVRVRMDLGADLPPVVASTTELQQVLLNLLNNSVDAIDQSGGTINFRTRYRDGMIVLDIADDGIGIAEANLPRIFDPFYTTKPVGQGTGLGLSICYGIIKKLGGEIKVQSAKQQGTTFTIFLPVLGEPAGKKPAGQTGATKEKTD